MGLDLSLTAPAAAVLPRGWKPGQWNIPTKVFDGGITRDEGRLMMIRDGVAHYAAKHYVTHVFIEGYSYGSQNAREALGELGGVIKVALWEIGLQAVPIPTSSARKTLLGTIKRSSLAGAKIKDYVNAQLAKMGAQFPTMDEGDAFVVANAGRASLGLPHVGV